MPRSAMATGLVDWVLPVRQMPEKLIAFRESSERMHLTDGDAEKVAEKINAEESLREILTILRVRTGHDFSNYKTPTLVRRIARHLQIHELEDIPTYLAFLRENPEEVQSLQRNLLINVTNFFRDKEAFEVLEREVVPKLLAGKTSRDTVRVWSAACASGEEAFSIAILLHEYAAEMHDPPKIQIFATDVDDEVINEAREHVYTDAIETDVSPERLKRFFVREGKRYRVKKELRESILFAPHNVLRDPPFSKLDLVTCRNLLIYLNRDTQERVMEIFHFALKPHGYLFLGSSETAESLSTLFSITDKKNRIYQRRATHSTSYALPRMPSAGQWQIKTPGAREIRARNKAFALGEVHYKLLENLAPPSVLVNQDFEVMYMSESVGRYLRFGGGEPTNNLLRLVHPDLLPDLRAALFTAQNEHKAVEFPHLRVVLDDKEAFVNLIVRSVNAVESEKGDFLLVIFDEPGRMSFRHSANGEADGDSGETLAAAADVAAHDKEDAMETIVQRLESDLQRTRAQLRATVEQHEVTIEELKASNEELQAINEELRSAGEELETSREELQSVNEELVTVNYEHKEKIDQISRSNSDLQNLIAATDIATIFLDRSLRIKRFTPRVEEVFNITHRDLGRPLEHFTNQLDYGDIHEAAAEVLRTLKPFEREVFDSNDRHFLTRILPYRTLDDHIEGVVLNFVDITERKRAEKAKFFLASIVESSEDSIITVSFEGTITSWNKAADKLYGYTAKEAIGKSMDLLMLPESLQVVFDNIDKIRLSRKVKVFDSIRVKKDGQEINLEVVLSPVRDENGEVIGVSTVARDVTRRRLAEETLRESEKRLRLAAEAAELGTWVWDLRTNELFGNEQHFLLFGLPPSAKPVTPEFFFQYVRPDDRERVKTELRKALTEKSIFKSEFCIVTNDGASRWASGYGRVTDEAPDGTALKMSGVTSDIDERKRWEKQMRKSEEHLNLILESTKDYAIITFDLEGRVTRWNSGAEKIFGYTEREAVGQATHFIFTPEDIAAREPEKELITALEKGRAEDERWHMRKDGSRFFASGVMQPLRDSSTQGFVKICRDQTDKLMIEDSQREREMLQHLVSMQEGERRRIARDIHDHLGQHLTALRLKLEAVKKMCDEGQICEEIEETQAIAELLDRDVDFLAWELRPASLDDLGLRLALGNFVKEWSSYAGTKAEFHANGLAKRRLAFEIETNLYRIAQEALNNIHKHAKAKNVSVLLEKRGDLIQLIIEDDGVGFNTKAKKNKVRGLGMDGMSERAKICGGELEIESAPKRGTTVFVRVPASFAAVGE